MINTGDIIWVARTAGYDIKAGLTDVKPLEKLDGDVFGNCPQQGGALSARHENNAGCSWLIMIT
jgi:hypothetical protein